MLSRIQECKNSVFADAAKQRHGPLGLVLRFGKNSTSHGATEIAEKTWFFEIFRDGLLITGNLKEPKTFVNFVSP